MGGFVPNLKTLNGRGAGGENAVTCLDEKVSEFLILCSGAHQVNLGKDTCIQRISSCAPLSLLLVECHVTLSSGNVDNIF